MKIRNLDKTSTRYKYQKQEETQYIFLIIFRSAIAEERSAKRSGPDRLYIGASDFNQKLTLSETMSYTTYFLAFQLCVTLCFSGSYCQAPFFKEITILKDYFVSMTF